MPTEWYETLFEAYDAVMAEWIPRVQQMAIYSMAGAATEDEYYRPRPLGNAWIGIKVLGPYHAPERFGPIDPTIYQAQQFQGLPGRRR